MTSPKDMPPRWRAWRERQRTQARIHLAARLESAARRKQNRNPNRGQEQRDGEVD